MRSSEYTDAAEPSEGPPRLLASPLIRVLLSTVLAFAIYGGWAFAVNHRHGMSAALWSGAAQGASSSLATFSLSGTVEYCFHRFRNSRSGLLAAWLVPPTLTAGLHAGMQWLVGTSAIALTILPSVVMGYVFAGAYVQGLRKLARAG